MKNTMGNTIKKEQQTIELFEEYANSSQRVDWETNVLSDIEFVNNAQWDISDAAALEANNIPAVCYNEMKPARDQVIQQITNNKPQYRAVARENSDVSLAGDISDFMSYLWDGSQGNLKFIKATENLEDTGVFILHSYYDPYEDDGRGEVKICSIDPRDWYPDPRSQERDAQDSSNQFLAYIKSETEVLMLYPDFDIKNAITWTGELRRQSSKNKSEGQSFDILNQRNEKYYRIIDRYEKINVEEFRIFDPESDFEGVYNREEYIEFAQRPALIVERIGGEKAIIKDSEVRKWIGLTQSEKTDTFHLMTDGSFMPGVEHEGYINKNGRLVMSVPGSTVKITITNIADLLNKKFLKWSKNYAKRIKRTLVIGEKLYREYVTPHSKFPFAVIMLHHTGTPYAYGDARLVRPIQEQINKARSLITAYNINIASLKVFVPDGTDVKQLEKKWGKAGAQFFTYDPTLGGIPVVLQYQQMSNALYEQIDRDKFLIQRIYGVYEFQDGAMQNAPQTKGGTILIDEFGQRRSRFKLSLIEEALNQLGYLISEMLPKYYDQRKIVRIVKPNAREKEVIFNDQQIKENGEIEILNDLKANRYDLKMVSGSTAPTNRTGRLDTALGLWDRQILRDDESILMLTDLPNVADIIERNSIIKQAEQTVNQLQDVIKNMQGNEQTMERELRHADRQIEKEKGKTKINELISKLSANTNMAISQLTKTSKGGNEPSEGAKEQNG